MWDEHSSAFIISLSYYVRGLLWWWTLEQAWTAWCRGLLTSSWLDSSSRHWRSAAQVSLESSLVSLAFSNRGAANSFQTKIIFGFRLMMSNFQPFFKRTHNEFYDPYRTSLHSSPLKQISTLHSPVSGGKHWLSAKTADTRHTLTLGSSFLTNPFAPFSLNTAPYYRCLNWFNLKHMWQVLHRHAAFTIYVVKHLLFGAVAHTVGWMSLKGIQPSLRGQISATFTKSSNRLGLPRQISQKEAVKQENGKRFSLFLLPLNLSLRGP